MKLIVRNLFLLTVGGLTLFVIVACEPNKKPLPSAEVSNVDTIYLQYPKLSEKDELLSGWLIKKKIRH